MKEDDLSITWMPGTHPAPETTLKTVHCGCNEYECKLDVSKGGRCFCLKAELPSTELCSCLNCHNKPDLEAPGEQFDDEDTDTDDSGGADEEF